MNMRKILFVSIVVLLVCQLGFAQVTAANSAITKVMTTGKPTPVLPARLARGPMHPTIWLSSKLGVKGKMVAGEPWFCDYNTGYQVAVCPKGLQTAYGTNFPSANKGAGMVIAIVDFFSYANAWNDLKYFDAAMGLPDPPFISVDVSGGNDGTGTGWDLESMLDIEYAHSMAPLATIVYIQGNPYSYGTDEESIAALGCPASPSCATLGVTQTFPGGDVVSNSWTFNAGEIPALDPYWNLGKPLLFASGDSSAWPYYSVTGYPCTSTYTTCVGGTSLYLKPNLTRLEEDGWAGAGGGCSDNFGIPGWQGNVGSNVCAPTRAAPDVSAIADPGTPVAVWICNYAWGCYFYGVGGTSVATPVLSGLVADIDAARVAFGKSKLTAFAPPLYPAATYNYNYYFYDVINGYNGFYAGPQYDLITGLGVPSGKAIGSRFFGIP